jgi:hypothetical protein
MANASLNPAVQGLNSLAQTYYPLHFLYYSDGHYHYQGSDCRTPAQLGLITSTTPRSPLGCPGPTPGPTPVQEVEVGATPLTVTAAAVSGLVMKLPPRNYLSDLGTGTAAARESNTGFDELEENVTVTLVHRQIKFIGPAASVFNACTFRLLKLEANGYEFYLADMCRNLAGAPTHIHANTVVRGKRRGTGNNGNIFRVQGQISNTVTAEIFVVGREKYLR